MDVEMTTMRRARHLDGWSSSDISAGRSAVVGLAVVELAGRLGGPLVAGCRNDF